MSDSTVDKMEAGLGEAQAIMVVVGIGGVVAGAALNKVMPNSTKESLKRRKSYVRKEVEKCEEKYPCPFVFLRIIIAVLNLVLYFLDIITDVKLCYTFYHNGHYGWFQIMAGFIALPYVVAVGGVGYYGWRDKWFDCSNDMRCLLFPFCPVLPIFLDILMPFYRTFQRRLPHKLVTFMVQYEATRTLSESCLESLPQMALQVYIFFFLQWKR